VKPPLPSGSPPARRVRRRLLGGVLGAVLPAVLRPASATPGTAASGGASATGFAAEPAAVRALQPAAVPALGTAAAPAAVPALEPAPSLNAAIRAFTGGATLRPGKVLVQVAPLVDNGNTVPLSVVVDHPMRPDHHVAAIALFSERNPQHEVANFQLGLRSAAARVSTRIRLATSQKLVAVARLSDGAFWYGEAEVIVTLSACIED